MKRHLSAFDVTGSLKAGLVVAVLLLDGAAPIPFATECEMISGPGHRPCNILINRPRQPEIPLPSPQ